MFVWVYVGVYVCVCVFVCLFVYPNKKKFSTDLKNSFFPRKVWTQGVTWAILEVSNTTPSCRKPDKPSKIVLRPYKAVLGKAIV